MSYYDAGMVVGKSIVTIILPAGVGLYLGISLLKYLKKTKNKEVIKWDLEGESMHIFIQEKRRRNTIRRRKTL